MMNHRFEAKYLYIVLGEQHEYRWRALTCTYAYTSSGKKGNIFKKLFVMPKIEQNPKVQ